MISARARTAEESSANALFILVAASHYRSLNAMELAIHMVAAKGLGTLAWHLKDTAPINQRTE